MVNKKSTQEGLIVDNIGPLGRIINIQTSTSQTKDGTNYVMHDEDKNSVYIPFASSANDVQFVMGIDNHFLTTYDYGGEFIVGNNNTLSGGYYKETMNNAIFASNTDLIDKVRRCMITGYNHTLNTLDTGSLIAGKDHTVSGSTQCTVLGTGNTVNTGSANSVTFGLGNTNAASGSLVGGRNNTAGKAAYGSIVMGRNNEVGTNDYDYVTMLGGQYNKMTSDTPYSMCYGLYASGNIKGSFEFASGRHLDGSGNGIQGSIQLSQFLLGAITTDATPVILSSKVDGSNTKPPILSNQSVMFTAEIVARRGSSTESAAYYITGAIKNDAGTTALVGTPTVTVVGEDDANWAVSVAANNTDDTLDITCTGAAAKRVHWVGTVRFTQTIIA
tara:strand:- start:164 stop:1324 length:1161 start_codon:yes stop_codon:yes gene_type:complete